MLYGHHRIPNRLTQRSITAQKHHQRIINNRIPAALRNSMVYNSPSLSLRYHRICIWNPLSSLQSLKNEHHTSFTTKVKRGDCAEFHFVSKYPTRPLCSAIRLIVSSWFKENAFDDERGCLSAFTNLRWQCGIIRVPRHLQ